MPNNLPFDIDDIMILYAKYGFCSFIVYLKFWVIQNDYLETNHLWFESCNLRLVPFVTYV